MFTGIIQELGVIESMSRSGDIYKLGVRSDIVSKGIKIGDSICVNGVCLTIVSSGKSILNFDMMAETARSTNLALLKNNDKVNLEGSLKAGGTLDGHFVLGHIDCVGRISDTRKTGGEFIIRVNFPNDFDHLVVEKGSIAIDGVSLTIGDTKKGEFSVYIIPHTIEHTTLEEKKSKDTVNLEFDILGKYVMKGKLVDRQARVSEKFLRDNGF